MKRNVFFLYFLFSAFFLKAQVGVLNIEEDAAVAKLMEIYVNNNKQCRRVAKKPAARRIRLCEPPRRARRRHVHRPTVHSTVRYAFPVDDRRE